MDRRRARLRTHTFTLGFVLVVMGCYAFSPIDTLFTQTLARLGVEDLWGAVLLASGGLLALSAASSHKYMRWAGNAAGGFAGMWTFGLCISEGLFTPTVAACGVIGIGCIATMVRDALSGQKYRCMMRQTGQWSALGNGD